MKTFFIWFLFICAASPVLAGQDSTGDKEGSDNFQYRTVVTKEGLHFRVPEDMPIEKRGGIEAPIPFDEYMYSRFQQIDKRLKNMEAMLKDMHDLTFPKKQESVKKQNQPMVAAERS